MISTPVDIEFEMLALGCAIHLLEQMRDNRFKNVSIEDDRRELVQEDLDWRRRRALMHRTNCKEIILGNIKNCQVLMRILANLQVALEKGQTSFTKIECKRLYMTKCVPYEETDQEVIENRFKFRNYIRELILNQQRMMEKIAAEKSGGEQGIQDLVDRIKSGELPERPNINPEPA